MTTSLPEILYTGSVKNVRGNENDDFVFFEFSDRYSIFDWGEMPDLLNGKGASLARFTDAVYTFLETSNLWKEWQVPTTYNQTVRNFLESSKAFTVLKTSGIKTHRYQADARIENLWKVKKIKVPKIENRNYSFYESKPVDTLVPLEVIFRFGTPSGSSLLRRLEKNPEYMYSLGLEQMPKEMEWFDRPIIEFSTKLESSDRYISYSEAKQIAGLSQEEFDLLYSYAALLALRLREEFKGIHLDLWDGKFEFAFTKGDTYRDFTLVDSMGPDEIRITYNNIHLSKEVLRQVYNTSSWYKKMDAFKSKSDDWQAEMKKQNLTPEKLPQEVKTSIESMYQALASAVEMYFLKCQNIEDPFQQIVMSLRKAVRSGDV